MTTGKRLADHEHSDSPKRRKAKTNSLPDLILVSTESPNPYKQTNVNKNALEKLVLAPRSQREKEDDAYIYYLERKLKGKKKAGENDGLDGTYPSSYFLQGLSDRCCVDLLDFTSSILPMAREVCKLKFCKPG